MIYDLFQQCDWNKSGYTDWLVSVVVDNKCTSMHDEAMRHSLIKLSDEISKLEENKYKTRFVFLPQNRYICGTGEDQLKMENGFSQGIECSKCLSLVEIWRPGAACPYKGDCVHITISSGGRSIDRARDHFHLLPGIQSPVDTSHLFVCPNWMCFQLFTVR